jgi:hypothetical protein
MNKDEYQLFSPMETSKEEADYIEKLNNLQRKIHSENNEIIHNLFNNPIQEENMSTENIIKSSKQPKEMFNSSSKNDFSKREIENIKELTKDLFSKFGKPFYSFYEKDGTDRSKYIVDYSIDDVYKIIESKLIDLIFGKIYSVGTASFVKYVENAPSINNRTFIEFRMYNTVKEEYLKYNDFNNLIDLFYNPNYCDFHDSIILEGFSDRLIYVRQSTLNPDVFLIYNATTYSEMTTGKQYEPWYHLIYFEGLSDYKKSKDIKDGECRTQSFKKEESSSSLNIPNDKVLVDKDLYTKIYSFYQQNFISEYTSNKIDEYIEKVKELEELEDNLLSSLVEYSENCIENSFSKYEDSEIVKSFLDRVLIYKANKVLTLDSKIFEKIN